ncbi:hypothetical protein SAMN05421505_11474 [Sinosporangium album]|uniref:Uncharacterized protein n=1 Tax=Sinosporangium album TaxID=504805 RepID=A0A1G8BKL9_9ACTN|nr:hypothetical protein [Sinosporangium album]SDH33668.1 hypothetical protein SAMN05421505_11474 [Sinosporangium album]
MFGIAGYRPAWLTGITTVAELAGYLAKGPIGPAQIRRILRGLEISDGRPYTYPLGDAAARLLTRKGKQ